MPPARHDIFTPSRPHNAMNEKQVHKKKRTGRPFGFLYSLTLTIPLLILLAALSIIGTLIPQNASEQAYLQRYSQETYYILKGLGLFDMYHSWWFITVLFLLAMNVLACSLKRLPHTWRQTRNAKGNYARLATSITHLSVLLILAGGLIGAWWGFKGYVEVREGEAFVVSSSPTPGKGPGPGGFQVRCDAFRVDLYPDGSPREYVSTLSFIQGDRVALDHVPLRVNHPVSYGGLTFYQSSYGISARPRIEVRQRNGAGVVTVMQLTPGEVQPIPGTRAQLGFMQYQADVQNGEGILLILFTPGAPHEAFWLVKSRPAQQGDFTFIVKDIEKRYYTGIQVSRDPGVPIVWLGCSLLIVGMIGTFTLRRPPSVGWQGTENTASREA
jgi:cytochrome c biogenesis protein